MKIRDCFFFLRRLVRGLRLAAYAVITTVSILFVSCDSPLTFSGASSSRITVMTWNAQTFFDAVDDGTEFDEFKTGPAGKAGGKWCAAKYGERLDRLCEVIIACGKKAGKEPGAGPDIAVLEEIENGRVVRDIVNRLPQRTTYRHAAFVPPARGAAFGTVVLSRYPVVSVSAHSVAGGETALRPLLEATLQVGNERLVVFAAHWKSKLGNDAETGSLRLEQEALLANRIEALYESAPDSASAAPSIWIACGDFNQKREEFSIMNRYENCWDRWQTLLADGSVSGPPGSYSYRGNWETIDNVFLPAGCATTAGCGGMSDGSTLWRLEDFAVVSESPFADTNFAPVRYESFSGKGYSDHLPLVMVLEKR